jgi:tetratricopeptide (TPR) repeat protein
MQCNIVGNESWPKLADAASEWAEAVELSRQQHDIPTLFRALRGVAETEQNLGRNREALAPYEEAVLLSRKKNDALFLAHTVRHLGDVRRHLGQHGKLNPATRKH